MPHQWDGKLQVWYNIFEPVDRVQAAFVWQDENEDRRDKLFVVRNGEVAITSFGTPWNGKTERWNSIGPKGSVRGAWVFDGEFYVVDHRHQVIKSVWGDGDAEPTILEWDYALQGDVKAIWQHEGFLYVARYTSVDDAYPLDLHISPDVRRHLYPSVGVLARPAGDEDDAEKVEPFASPLFGRARASSHTPASDDLRSPMHASPKKLKAKGPTRERIEALRKARTSWESAPTKAALLDNATVRQYQTQAMHFLRGKVDTCDSKEFGADCFSDVASGTTDGCHAYFSSEDDPPPVPHLLRSATA